MQFSIEQVPWMPSPPLVPTPMPLDVSYLRSMTLGDTRLEREVLELFKAQTRDLLAQLAPQPQNCAELAHTLKGSARAIGAFEVGEAAYALESGLGERGGFAAAFKQLQGSVDEVFEAIDAHLAGGN
jgi:HPt (histidine-containing phosphotransfer) domain-containing protein